MPEALIPLQKSNELIIDEKMQPLREQVSQMKDELIKYKEKELKDEGGKKVIIHEAPKTRVAFVLRCKKCQNKMYELPFMDVADLSTPRIARHNFIALGDNEVPSASMRPYCKNCNEPTDLELIIDNTVIS